jgi:hypothetical protein
MIKTTVFSIIAIMALLCHSANAEKISGFFSDEEIATIKHSELEKCVSLNKISDKINCTKVTISEFNTFLDQSTSNTLYNLCKQQSNGNSDTFHCIQRFYVKEDDPLLSWKILPLYSKQLRGIWLQLCLSKIRGSKEINNCVVEKQTKLDRVWSALRSNDINVKNCIENKKDNAVSLYDVASVIEQCYVKLSSKK